MFKKLFYGSRIAPARAYCAQGTPAADSRMVLCRQRGVVSPYYCCRKFVYDPLQRTPHRQELPRFDPSDFSLDDEE